MTAETLNSGTNYINNIRNTLRKIPLTNFMGKSGREIGKFEAKAAEAPGFMGTRSASLKTKLESNLNRPLTTCSLGKAAVSGDHFVVGHDDPSAKEHWLMCLNGHTMIEHARDNSMRSWTQSPGQIRDLRFLSPTLLLTSIDSGTFHLFDINFSKNCEFVNCGKIETIHSAGVREVALSPTNSLYVASGGNDSCFCITNLSQSNVLSRVKFDEFIGSVKWSFYNACALVSLTIDSGQFEVFDTRQPVTMKHFAFHLNTEKGDLFSHEWINENQVLLGFGDGWIKMWDKRKPNVLMDSVQDPYTEAIGNIEFNEESQAFVTSGYTDFTVWRQKANEFNIWSHEQPGMIKRTNTTSYTTNCTFFDNDTILCTNSDGHAALYIQQFK